MAGGDAGALSAGDPGDRLTRSTLPRGEGRGERGVEARGYSFNGSTPLPPLGALPPSSPSRRGGDRALLLALAFPAVFVNLGHGHNGFLTAALIGFALLWLDRRPVVAGILFGLSPTSRSSA